MEAYILIEGAAGRTRGLAGEVARIPGIRSVHTVTGPYDVIARAEAESARDLGEGVLRRIARLRGITRALACPVGEDAPGPGRVR